MVGQKAKALDSERVCPTVEHSLFGGAVLVLVFGRPKTYARLIRNQPALRTIVGHALDNGAQNIYAPKTTTFNALVVDPRSDQFGERLSLGSATFHTGKLADGVLLTEPSAFFIASADCPTFIARFPNGDIVATHAGRNSLIDMAVVKGGRHREHGSVIFAAAAHCHGNLSKMQTALICGIGSPSLCHPRIGLGHKALDDQRIIDWVLRKWGCQLDLYEIVKAQLCSLGAPTDSISFFYDHVDTYRDGLSRGEPVYHSHRRDSPNDGRNGVLVIKRR